MALKSLSTRPRQTTLTTVYAQKEAPLQTSTDLYRPLQTSTDLYRPQKPTTLTISCISSEDMRLTVSKRRYSHDELCRRVGSLFSYKSLSTWVPAGCASLRPHPPPRGASYRAGRRARGTAARYPRQLVHMRSHAILPRPMPNRAEHAPTRARTHRTAHPRPRTTDHTRPPSEMTTEKQKTVVLLVGRLCTPIGRL